MPGSASLLAFAVSFGLAVLTAPGAARASEELPAFGLPAGSAPLTARSGEPVDLALFGVPVAGESSTGIEWENPRDVLEVRAVYDDPGRTPTPDLLKVEWWASVWPNNGTGGWMRLDDRWNGQWLAAAAKAIAGPRPGVLSYTLQPLTKAEWKEAPESGPPFRRTLKVRLTGPADALPRRLEVLGRSRWREGSFDIEVRRGADGELAGRVECRNGFLLGIESLPPPRTAVLEGPVWRAQGPAGGSAGVRARVLFAESGDTASADLTRVTVRLGAAPEATGFSFLPQDVLQEGAVRVADLGALVAESASRLSLANDPGPPGRPWRRPVRRRIPEEPEMTRARAMEAIPRLAPARWAPLGVPSARQEPLVGPLGDWSVWTESLHTKARDSERIPFHGKVLDALLDTRAEPRFDGGGRDGLVRSLEEGRLPMVHAEWRTGPLRFRHSLFATVLLGAISDDAARRGDETVVLLTRLEISNPTEIPQTAAVSLRYSHGAPISLKSDGTIAIESGEVPEGGRTALRGIISTDRPAGGGSALWSLRPVMAPGTSAVLRFEARVEPGATRRVFFKAPFVDLLEPAEAERLRAIGFEEEAPRVLSYWRDRIEKGLRIVTPCEPLNDLVDANLWHILITTDRDPETGLFNQGVGTFSYKVFANETVMVARAMDGRGEHVEAERFLEPFLRFQGSEPLTGRFSTKEDVFHGAGAYTHGQYAMNHGFVLWGLADHFLLSGDGAWMERCAGAILRGCDFLIRERKAPLGRPGAPRPPIQGLSPASSLEDVVEFQYWLATNAYFHLGLRRAAEALAGIGHPEAGRIAREAEAYRADIERAAREAATVAATVRLRDGRWIPYVPSRIFQWRHLTEGWIREALYPALHLATGEVVPAGDPLMTWMLDDLEDMIFLSAESGFGVKDVDAKWFGMGGVTLQPCLLDTPMVYLERDEVEAALRSFWNVYALSIYPDIQCFAEWAKAFGVGGGPVYKTSDEARFVMWLRQLLIHEDGGRLWFGRGVPREWLEDGKEVRVERAVTSFGAAGLHLASEADRGRIRADLEIPGRRPPREVWLRLRHPAGKRPLRVLLDDGTALSAERIVGEDIRLDPLPPAPAAAGGAAAPRRLSLTAEYGP